MRAVDRAGGQRNIGQDISSLFMDWATSIGSDPCTKTWKSQDQHSLIWIEQVTLIIQCKVQSNGNIISCQLLSGHPENYFH